MTILTVNNEIPAKKIRKINIYKDKVFDEVDRITYRYADAAAMQDVKQRNAVTSDAGEAMDRVQMDQMARYRDSLLRRRLVFALSDKMDSSASNAEGESSVFAYNLVLDEGFDDNNIQPMADMIHRYFVYGILCDWYSQLGQAQYAVYESKLGELEMEIVSMARGKSIHKRPLQPFGPAGKIDF